MCDVISLTRRPLQVYLDSSDFSNLSHADKRRPFVDVERQLLEWREAGKIELRFSFAHVAELAPVEPRHVDFSRARAECVVRLCGAKTLVAPGDIFEREVRAFISKGVWPRGSGLVDDGNWMPSSFLENIDLPSIPELVAEAASTEPLNRAMRRKLKQQYVGAGRTLKAAGRRHLQEQLPETIEMLKRDFPLTDAGVAAARRYYLGQGSPEDVKELMTGSVRDVRMFIEWYSRRWDVVSPMTAWFRQEGVKLFSALSRGRSLLIAMIEAERACGTSDAELAARFKGKAHMTALRLVAELLVKVRDGQAIVDVSEGDAATFLPGVWASAKVIGEVMASSMARMKNPRNMKESDFGDVVHCVYLPYVDVFRVDGPAKEIVKAVKLPFDTEVVRNLHDLPEAIERKLALPAAPPAVRTATW